MNTGLEKKRQRASTGWQRSMHSLLLAEDKLLSHHAHVFTAI
jgi:hypothetical protein